MTDLDKMFLETKAMWSLSYFDGIFILSIYDEIVNKIKNFEFNSKGYLTNN